MRVTIVKDDNIVIVDGEACAVDCSQLPTNFHALQWSGEHGEVEYASVRCNHCGGRSKKANEVVFDLAPYQPYVDAWQLAKAAAEAKALEAANAAGPQG